MAVALGLNGYSLFVVSICLYSALILAGMMLSFHKGSGVGAVSMTLMASAIPYYSLAWVMEHRPPWEVFNLVHGSWSFLIGDTVVASYVAYLLALGWRRLRSLRLEGKWYMSFWALVGWAFIGLILGALFHLHESTVFAASLLSSPTKLYHDLAAFTILFGGLMYGLVAVMANKASRRFGWFALVGVVAMLMLMGLDNSPLHRLDPSILHGPYYWG